MSHFYDTINGKRITFLHAVARIWHGEDVAVNTASGRPFPYCRFKILRGLYKLRRLIRSEPRA